MPLLLYLYCHMERAALYVLFYIEIRLASPYSWSHAIFVYDIVLTYNNFLYFLYSSVI